ARRCGRAEGCCRRRHAWPWPVHCPGRGPPRAWPAAPRASPPWSVASLARFLSCVRVDLRESSRQMFTDRTHFRLVDDGEVVTAELDDLEVGDAPPPSAVRVGLRVARLEFDGAVVHALGAVEDERHLGADLRPLGQVDTLEDAVVHEAGPLVLDHAAAHGVGLGTESLEQHLEDAVLTML